MRTPTPTKENESESMNDARLQIIRVVEAVGIAAVERAGDFFRALAVIAPDSVAAGISPAQACDTKSLNVPPELRLMSMMHVQPCFGAITVYGYF